MTDKPISERLRAASPAVAAFLTEIDEVCLKHGLTLEIKSDKRAPRGFEVHHYNRTARNTLFAAAAELLGEPKPNQVEETRETVVWLSRADASEQTIASYKDYFLRLAASFEGPGVDGFINGRLRCHSVAPETAKQTLYDIVDLLDPTDLTTKG